ncbi:hypothetical protein DUNSADRAFT_3209 [Dunaliella salina]|uniref:Uncharacterized protein n=1 Tax=Dunaliella salina TaxID=3046 RepID=A0ABQ7GUC7_DUNSA|nr:hypothetical protein DUNSADRAFT_3209 [Dunaliella salina]|eukprot:KAF5838229.1 hypothetical protein DUNSADRAFT_3209 [Dunaliella salina]
MSLFLSGAFQSMLQQHHQMLQQQQQQQQQQLQSQQQHLQLQPPHQSQQQQQQPQQQPRQLHARPSHLTVEVPCSTPGSSRRSMDFSLQGALASLGQISGSLQGEGARRPSSNGAASDEDGPRTQRQLEPYVRPPQLGQPMPPAKGSALLGRGVTKMKEVLRVIRKSMLAIEENVPWELVEDSWKSRRSAWRKALKNLEAGTGAAAAAAAHARVGLTEGLVVAVACAILELHGALLTDKSPLTGGVFARGSIWESRLIELAEGVTNPHPWAV